MLLQVLDFCTDTEDIWNLVAKFIFILKIAIPILIVILATLDLGKAVTAGEEKKIKEAQDMLVKRLIYGVAIFFVVTLVQTVFGLVQVKDESGRPASACWDAITQKNPFATKDTEEKAK